MDKEDEQMMDEFVVYILGESQALDAVAIVKLFGFIIVFDCIVGLAHAALNARSW